MTLKYIRNDGGRALAGFPATGGDCLTRAIAITSGKPYRALHDELSALAHKGHADEGMPTNDSFLGWMDRNGYRRTSLRRPMRLGYRSFRRGRYVIAAACPGVTRDAIPVGHAYAVVDGVVHDAFRPSPDWPVHAYWRYEK